MSAWNTPTLSTQQWTRVWLMYFCMLHSHELLFCKSYRIYKSSLLVSTLLCLTCSTAMHMQVWEFFGLECMEYHMQVRVRPYVATSNSTYNFDLWFNLWVESGISHPGSNCTSLRLSFRSFRIKVEVRHLKRRRIITSTCLSDLGPPELQNTVLTIELKLLSKYFAYTLRLMASAPSVLLKSPRPIKPFGLKRTTQLVQLQLESRLSAMKKS